MAKTILVNTEYQLISIGSSLHDAQVAMVKGLEGEVEPLNPDMGVSASEMREAMAHTKELKYFPRLRANVLSKTFYREVAN